MPPATRFGNGPDGHRNTVGASCAPHGPLPKIDGEQEALVGKGGVVVLFQAVVQGWLRDPEHWQPGCIAVDEQGRTWTTIAGSERDGALMWLANHEL